MHAKLLKGPAFFAGENIAAKLTFRHVSQDDSRPAGNNRFATNYVICFKLLIEYLLTYNPGSTLKHWRGPALRLCVSAT